MEFCKEIMKPFEAKKDFMEDMISSGIEQNRKGYMYLKFVDEKGEPIKGVKVKAVQKTHDFKFGANLFMLDEFEKDEQNEAYKKYYADAFNIATLPFYWSDLEPEQGKPRYAKDSPKVYRRPAPDLCLEYCKANGIEPKMHCLNYPTFAPEWAKGSIEWEKQCLEKRFKELSERYAKRIPMWEVTNETFYPHIPRHGNFFGEPDFVEWSFALAEKYFPANKLVINEAHCWVWNRVQRDRAAYYMQIERAMLKGARIDAIGMQYHMFYTKDEALKETPIYYDPEQMWSIMDTYARFNKPMHITEMTIPVYSENAADEEMQAKIIRNVYSLMFAHPAMEGILYWNLIDGFAHNAKPGDMSKGENMFYGGLLRFNFTAKPAFELLKELIHKTWHTEVELKSESNEVSFKGFYGEYDLEISTDSGTTTKRIHLNKHMFNNLTITV